MRPLVVPPDAPHIVRDVLAAALLARGETCTVGVGVPVAWTLTSPTHVQVFGVGDPIHRWPVMTVSTIRVTVWSASTTTSKALAALCIGLLYASPIAGGMSGTEPLTGVLATRDPDTRAELAFGDVGVTLRLTAA